MMTVPDVTPELLARVDGFSVSFHAARMGALSALPGNPFGVTIRFFGGGVAVQVGHPLLAGKNRILGFGPGNLDLLDELLHFYRDEQRRFTLSVPPGQTTLELFRRLVQAGLWTGGSGTVPAIAVPVTTPCSPSDVSAAPGISVRRSGLGEKDLYLDLFQQAFAQREESAPEYRSFQWAEDSLPGGVRYIAEIAGRPVAMASFPVIDGIGLLGTAGVIPEYRGRGVQAALIGRRLAEAPSLGCDLVLAGGSPGTTTYRNFERAGLGLIPTGSVWGENPI